MNRADRIDRIGLSLQINPIDVNSGSARVHLRANETGRVPCNFNTLFKVKYKLSHYN